MRLSSFRSRVLIGAAALAFLASAAEAGEFRRHQSAQGRFGRGFNQDQVTRWGSGRISRETSRAYNNGRNASWSREAQRNGDGSVTLSRSHLGAQGRSQSDWRTIARTDDGYRVDRELSTSGGRGLTGSKDVSYFDDRVVVDRSYTTASGESRSWSRSYPRGW